MSLPWPCLTPSAGPRNRLQGGRSTAATSTPNVLSARAHVHLTCLLTQQLWRDKKYQLAWPCMSCPSASVKRLSENSAPVAAEPTADPQPAEDAAPASPQAPAVEAVEASPAKAAAAPAETPEEAKVEKKEKSPKDLAKLAQRFSGRLFGAVGEKKKEPTKKPEPTQEEEAESAAPAEPVPVSDAAPQIPANTTPEVSQAATEPAPVIAAAA
ncbi:hypothetical protein PtA15_2A409 [Puccinia triticina]|uniref:Uncharacterized protein n=1 Tax=Puccinia triticina TaxID=208348 RepID=A0ABY7CA98_9BASI|nr:uncharacterized protein PtA15_2A409 [Puccinia triticina]WAQ82096.1 hypothetical protein PtA15_2A409 [Puccinia triticina]